jgi:hypothetical protein
MKAGIEMARERVHSYARALLGAIALTILVGLGLLAPGAALAIGGPPIISESSIFAVQDTRASVQALVDPNLKETTYFVQYITETAYQEDGEAFGAGTKATAPLEITEDLDEAHPVSVTIEGLAPATFYRTRLFAENIKGEVGGEVLPFATYPEASAALPDSRAYEQASPLDKNAGDALGIVPFVKAAFGGGGITFGSTSGIPGAEGAQELPTYLASREGEGEGTLWRTQGLLPPASLGPGARLVGWTPGFTHVFQQATHFVGEGKTRALFERPGPGGEETQITPYLPTSYAYAGSAADDSTAIFESSLGKLATTPPGAEGHSNVYAWDGSSLHLASVLPDGEVPVKGAFAGPYDWVHEKTTAGGAAAFYYTQEERAVSGDGSVFFTTAGDGHLYQRRNPTQPPAPEAEDCAASAKACTLDASPSRRTPRDPGGERPRAFAGASADGNTAFFTSAEELTDDAKTGPAVQPPTIGRATIGAPPEEEAEEALPQLLPGHHAVGVATRGEYIYWADPSKGTIGRAKLNGSSPPSEVDDEYVVPGETCAETHPVTLPGQEQCAPTAPRYVAVDDEYVYWTNTGPLGGDLNKVELEQPVIGAGTIGRAKLGAVEGEEVEPEFIVGASNPQGIAVNESHIYWANSLENALEHAGDIARAEIDGEEVEQHFHVLTSVFLPFGVALSATRVYWVMETSGALAESYVASIPLGGGGEESIFFGNHHKPRGVAVLGPHVYWAAQGLEAIGRAGLELEDPETEFLSVQGGLGGLASDGSHLFWSANGEIPPHPGNDLYRYRAKGTGGCAEAGGCLTDLTPDSADPNGAEVKGVLGVSEEGTRAYFAANADLDGTGAAAAGNCEGKIDGMSGSCSLYEWEASGGPGGTVSFVARLLGADAVDWVGTINGFVFQGVQKTSQLSPDGQTLLFLSREKLTAYESEGTPELYRHRSGEGITCVSCDPTGLAPDGSPSLGSIVPSALRVAFTSATASRNLSADGNRVFFETPERLSVADTNGEKGCDPVGSPLQGFPACQDVYDWEAPGSGSCEEGAPAYSPQNEGCLYLISTGKSDWASLMGDASADGNDVFFFTRQGLVGQDKDELLDVYDARVGGGIASQSPPPPPPPCETPEACRPYAYPPEGEESPGSAGFAGPPDPQPEHAKAKKGKKHRKHHRHRHHRRKAHRAHSKRRAGR